MTKYDDELVGLLKDRPAPWSKVVAARSALRALPYMAPALQAGHAHGHLVHLFRALFVADFISSDPAGTFSHRSAADEASKSLATDIDYPLVLPLTSARAAADSAAAARVMRAAAGAIASTTSAANALAVFEGHAELLFDIASADVRFLVSGRNVVELRMEPLLNHDSEIKNAFRKRWSLLQEILRNLQEGWDVWIDWYDAVLNGKQRWNLTIEQYEGLADRLFTVRAAWWQHPSNVVNAEIARWISDARLGADFAAPDAFEDSSLSEDDMRTSGQVPAAYAFQPKSGKIVAVAQAGAALDPDIVGEILPELAKKAEVHLRAIRGHGNAPPFVHENAASISDILSSWPSSGAPGVLLMRLRSLDAIVEGYDGVEGRAELYPSARAAMLDLRVSLEDFLSMHPAIKAMQANALALRIQRSDVEMIDAKLVEIEELAASSEAIDATTIAALAEGRDSVRIDTEIIKNSSDSSKVAAAIEARAEQTAHRVLSGRNFMAALVRSAQDGAIEGTKSGVRGVVSGGIKSTWAAVVTLFAGPFAGIAALVTSLQPVAEKADEIEQASSRADASETNRLERTEGNRSPTADGQE